MYRVAIVGSGPAGLSAACRAAESGMSHILLEAQPHAANTIYRFQKGKHVMAEPGVLPLRAAAAFKPGTRERTIEAWQKDLERHRVNVRHRSEVTRIERGAAGFRLTLASGQAVDAEKVVLAIGVQGNIRKLGAPGEDLPRVQYQLDDPDEYRKETVVVVGAGDAAIENAVALARHNTVIVVNRKGEFSRAKEGNNELILKAIADGRVQCQYHSSIERVDALPPGGKPLRLRLNSKEGVLDVDCDRIIGRLGSTPSRAFVEACGVKFPSEDPSAVPAVSPQYESNVPGLYIVGALAGYPLIKQAMNQGYEVIESIAGRKVVPADEPLLQQKIACISGVQNVDMVLDVLRARSPVLQALTPLQLREFMLESQLHALKADQVVYRKGDYGNSVLVVITGHAKVRLDPDDPSRDRKVKPGRIFGEMALISGRPRSATVLAGEDCVLLEIPRRAMLKLISSQPAVRQIVDRTFALRAIQTYLAPEAEESELQELVASTRLCQFKANEVIYDAGVPADALHLVRSGSVMLTARDGEREVVMGYVPAGQYFGEVDVIAGGARQQGARAAIKTETLRVDAGAFLALLNKRPALREAVRQRFRERIQQRLIMESAPERGAMMQFLLAEGLGEATDALLIDESLCIGCDQCEKACADTHGQVSRLDRQAGATFSNLHVPTSCRHCEHPHCMKECPPDAIHRAANGEVYIENTCIGCGNCERNCPYGVIQMGAESTAQPSLWRWMLFGQGLAPGAEQHAEGEVIKKAVKCDMCRDRPAGPACVQACPTGAALRLGPEEFFAVLTSGSGR
jgi:CRP-like cAMP-binding protein/thioredoxin reductase